MLSNVKVFIFFSCFFVFLNLAAMETLNSAERKNYNFLTHLIFNTNVLAFLLHYSTNKNTTEESQFIIDFKFWTFVYTERFNFGTLLCVGFKDNRIKFEVKPKFVKNQNFSFNSIIV